MRDAAAHEHDALLTCARLLAELGLAGQALAAAADAGDLVGALAASHESRRLRTELARRPLPAQVGADIDLLELETLVAGGRTTAAIVERWRQRILPPGPELVRTPLGVACLADELLPTTWDVTRDLAVLVGPGLERVAEHLLDLGHQRVLVIADADAAAAYPATALVCHDVEEAARAVRLMHECPPERVAVRGLADGAATGAVAEAVHQALCDLRVHHNTLAAFSTTWIRQGAQNLPALARWPSVADVGDRLAGVPMFVCAPGPSLAGNVAQLRAVRGRALVVGFSHSLRPLRAAGVVPDIVLTVDPQDVRYHFAEGDLDGVGAVINGLTVHPALYQLGAARYLTLASNGALDRWLYQALGGGAEVPAGGSVATTAVALGLRWRCDPIVTVGLDLSFPGGRWYVDTSCDGQAHAVVGADGTIEVAGWSDGFCRMKAAGGPGAARERAVELPGWHGGTVPSSFMFAMFHRWFEDTAARVAADGGPRLVNATEGGAFIRGMDHRPLAEVVAGLGGPIDVAGAFDAAIAAIDPDARARRAQTWLARTRRELATAERVARRGVALAAAAAGAGGERSLGALRRVERTLGRLLGRHGFVAMQAQRAITDAFDEARHPARPDEYLAATARLMEAAAEAAAAARAQLAGAGGPP